MKQLIDFAESIPSLIPERFETVPLSAGKYENMSWPAFPAVMKFKVSRLRAEGFGSVMAMRTNAMGLMKLVTISLTPNEGLSVPYLLIDIMSMGNKRTVFVEYYDTRAVKQECPLLKQVYAEYDALLADYAEKPHWYVSERMKCSLIKSGNKADEAVLFDMVEDSLRAYFLTAAGASADSENLGGLKTFCERMINEGNPSTATLERVLGKAGAEEFFRETVLPVKPLTD